MIMITTSIIIIIIIIINIIIKTNRSHAQKNQSWK